jgi:hypothetical protein
VDSGSEGVDVSYAGTSLLVPWQGLALAPLAPKSQSFSCWNKFEVVSSFSSSLRLCLAMVAGIENIGGTEWRPNVLELCHGFGRSSASSFSEPLRWWPSEGEAGEVLLIKWHPLLWRCGFAQRCLSSPAGHGGLKGGGEPVSLCRRRGGWGNSVIVLIHAAGCYAVAIHCRQGGASSTSISEALIRHHHRCSNPHRREVMRSPR